MAEQRASLALLGWDSIEQGIDPQLKMPAKSSSSHMGGWNDEASSVDAWCFQTNCGY